MTDDIDIITPDDQEGGSSRNTTLIIIVVVALVLLCCCCLTLVLAWNYGDSVIDALEDLAWRSPLALI